MKTMEIFKFFALTILVTSTTFAKCNAQSSPAESKNEQTVLGSPANQEGDFATGKTSVKASRVETEEDGSTSEWALYMADLQHRVKENWFPPKGDETKRVVVSFKILKSGKLSNLRLTKSSGITVADSAALKAVKNSAPFHPLLPSCEHKSIDIAFTFDYKL